MRAQAVKRLLKATPIVGPALVGWWRGKLFRNSGQYWERRYRRGGNSGAGSYERLAVFKADVLNDFIATHRIRSVIDFGCGDGAQLRLAQYPRYIGIDVSAAAVDMCRARFSSDPQKSFYRVGETPTDLSAELALSMDVVYHLVEDDIFDAYMRDLFAAATRYVVIYASNEDEPWRSPHVRHRKFTDWIERNEPAWRVAQHIPNEYPYDPADPQHTSFADFYMFANS